MTLENLAWALFGFALAGAVFAIFYDWSLRVVTEKWLGTVDKIHANAKKSMAVLWENGYDQGVKDTKAARAQAVRRCDSPNPLTNQQTVFKPPFPSSYL